MLGRWITLWDFACFYVLDGIQIIIHSEFKVGIEEFSVSLICDVQWRVIIDTVVYVIVTQWAMERVMLGVSLRDRIGNEEIGIKKNC